MKISDLKPDDPWFAAPETQALVAWLREERDRAIDTAISKVRALSAVEPLEYVGQSDGYRKTINMLTPENKNP